MYLNVRCYLNDVIHVEIQNKVWKISYFLIMLIRAMVLYLRIRYNIFLKHSIAFTYCLHIKGQLFYLFFFLLLRPKIKFYLFAIAYLPTLLLPTQLCFRFSRSNFFFFFFFAVSIFQFQSEILHLYKLMRKPPTGIAFIPHFLSLFLLWWLSYLFTFQCRRVNFIQSS